LVVHVTFGLDVGGQEKLLVELARHADRGQCPPVFVSLGKRGRLADDLEGCGTAVVALEKPTGLRPSLVFQLMRLFRSWRPRAVHTHDQRSLIYAAPAARLAGVPRLIHTRHGRDVEATSRQRAVVQQLSRLVDAFVCVSGDVEALSRSQGVAPDKLKIVRNGIDLNRFAFSGLKAQGPAVTVARLSPEKDVANLICATELAAREVPDLRVEVAGQGVCFDELNRLSAEMNLADRVQFLGEVDDVPSLLIRARMFVLPSRSEGIPLTVLEAMARGLPIVATRVGGLPEVVIEGETGFLVPPSDPAALAAAMVRLFRDEILGYRMGEAGRRRVEQAFDIRRMVHEYETLYLESSLAR
jgi:sugar transferase (PEP-CTERM/EpsH1 system associated)